MLEFFLRKAKKKLEVETIQFRVLFRYILELETETYSLVIPNVSRRGKEVWCRVCFFLLIPIKTGIISGQFLATHMGSSAVRSELLIFGCVMSKAV